MEAVLSGDCPAHSTAWRGPGRGGRDGRLTDSPASSQPRSMAAPLTHMCADYQNTAEMSLMEEILDEGVGRGLMFLHQPLLLSTHPPLCTPNLPRLTNSQDSKSPTLKSHSFPPPHLLPIFRLLQQRIHTLTVRCTSKLTVYPTPNL